MAKAIAKTGTKAQTQVPVTVDSIRILKEPKATLAFADVNIGGLYVVKGFKICQSKAGHLYIKGPEKQGKDGKWYEQAFPVTRESRNYLEDKLVTAYQAATKKTVVAEPVTT